MNIAILDTLIILETMGKKAYCFILKHTHI
jgi:hypothetical protein